MVERVRKKKNKLRGHRSHGKGNTKNNRGGGSRGGRGRAGLKKHKFSGQGYLLFKHGHKKKLNSKSDLDILNMDDINKFIENNKNVEKSGESYVIDGVSLKFDKLLGRGKLKYSILLKNAGVSKKAAEKITSLNGKIDGMEIE